MAALRSERAIGVNRGDQEGRLHRVKSGPERSDYLLATTTAIPEMSADMATSRFPPASRARTTSRAVADRVLKKVFPELGTAIPLHAESFKNAAERPVPFVAS